MKSGIRRWYVNAAKRARDCGYDLVCLYGAHGFGIIQHFLSRTTNKRNDEYGGSLENRGRFMRSYTDIREAVGDTMGVTVRLSLDEAFDELSFPIASCATALKCTPTCLICGIWHMAHGKIVPAHHVSRMKARRKT